MSFIVFLVIGLQQAIQYLFMHSEGHILWLVFGLIAVKWIGVEHPPVTYEIPLNFKRKVVGWVAIIIFILCITPKPWYFTLKRTNTIEKISQNLQNEF
jgi:hypothetical protein